MTLTNERIPTGSYAIRLFDDGDSYGESDIQTVLVLFNLGEGICEIGLAHGHLSDEANIRVGFKAYELGFHTLNFHVLRGHKATHWANHVNSDSLFDYYTVDLPTVIANFLSEQE